MKIFHKISQQYKAKLPFVAYKKPADTSVSGFFQQDDKLYFTSNYSESGFVFAPFNDNKKSILIPNEKASFSKELIKGDTNESVLKSIFNDEFEKEYHCKIIDEAIKEITDGKFRKVVISRKEEVALDTFDLITTLKRLLFAYPNAMVYVWYHPKVGLWLGATPETLVKINGEVFETMSLAGTQVNVGQKDVIWQSKELDEQQVVTDYIVEKLRPICEEVSAEKVETVKAGNLFHLKTKIRGKLKTQNSKLISSLHPTPAVCGFPKEVAKEFILKKENYNREFYTGFLGELNFSSLALNSSIKTESSELFVNLRCMQIKNEKALIYVGGGITKSSISEKEWQETVAKSQTMKKVL